ASGTCRSSGSSSSGLASARSCITDAAVNVVVIEATANWVSTVASSAASTAARPIASDQTSEPERKTPATTHGSRPWRCAPRTIRAKASSGTGQRPESARDQLDRPLDVVVADVQVRDRPQAGRVGRHREPDAVIPEPGERLLPREPERTELD